MTWQEQIAGARMTVDQEFSARVRESTFSRQQWGLIMTAVEFDIEDPGDAEAARMVADTSKLEHVMPQLDEVDQRMGVPGAGSGSGATGGGIVDGIKDALGLGDDGGDDLEAAAAALAGEYAAELQAHLEEQGRWDSVRQQAAEE